ncbi:M48 family metalloprotease [Euzebya sp.]|uniref:M48 family metalloprotease n=1 Tax=Euzebya sp. TaxID=1971409 RepID=UPI003515F0C5
MFKSFKTFVLLAGLSGLLLFAGQAIGGSSGLVTALVIAMAMNVGTYWFSDKLAIKMARGEPADEASYPWYHEMVNSLSARAGQPAPRLYISPSPQPNAFATGRNPAHAAVCVNQGLIDLLNRDEMEGVIAHELSHVYNRDILIGTIAATIATAITFMARIGFWFGGGRDREGGAIGGIAMLILAPIAAALLQFAVTRSRETQADTSGAELSGKPLALASALQKLEAGGRQLARRGVGGTPAEASSAFQSLYISAPFGGLGQAGNLFRTHPKTEDRVANLQRIAREMGQIA